MSADQFDGACYIIYNNTYHDPPNLVPCTP